MANLFLKFKVLLFVVIAVLLSGCTQFLFQPTSRHVITPERAGLSYQDHLFSAADGLQLHSWWLPAAGKARATVLYVHGNGQNISNHFGNVYWLPESGVNVLIFDYRGYGQSEGQPSLPGAIADIELAVLQALELSGTSPVIVVSHSLGASMSIHALARSEAKSRIAGAVFVSSFSDYQQVTRDVLSRSWLFWPFQYPLSWTINNDYAPKLSVAKLAPLPQLYMHSPSDHIVNKKHSELLFELAGEPKQFEQVRGGHNGVFNAEENRRLLLDTIEQWIESPQ
ncbi:alpha/beta hydrolase [Pseudomonadota bacterium]